MSYPISLKELFYLYKQWVSTHPYLVSDIETIAKWLSYFVVGKMSNTHIFSELVYSLSNLLVLFNDRIIYKSLNIKYKEDEVSKLKLLLTTLEYCEVFIELSVKQYLGDRAKWVVITLLQMYKCICRLILLYQYKEEIIQTPVIKPLERRNEAETTKEEEISEASLTCTLKKSGRIIRKIDASPPKELRTWNPPGSSVNPNSSKLKENTLMAETLYIMKPILHLAAMRCFGTHSWKMWLVALGFDVASLRMYSAISRKPQCALSKQHRLELSRRCAMMLMYFMRSPFYEKYGQKKVIGTLKAIGRTVPFANSIIAPFLQYLPHWQSTYFHTWSVRNEILFSMIQGLVRKY